MFYIIIKCKARNLHLLHLSQISLALNDMCFKSSNLYGIVQLPINPCRKDQVRSTQHQDCWITSIISMIPSGINGWAKCVLWPWANLSCFVINGCVVHLLCLHKLYLTSGFFHAWEPICPETKWSPLSVPSWDKLQEIKGKTKCKGIYAHMLSLN